MTIISNERLLRPAPLHICSVGRYNPVAELSAFENQVFFSGQAWPSNNLAIYTPVNIPERFTVARFMIVNSDSGNNVDLGLYSASGVRLMSTGSTVRTSGVQYIGVINQSFPPGHYFLAAVISSSSRFVLRTLLQSQYDARMCGLLQEALGTTTLPATMTPASYGQVDVYCYGFTQSDSL